MYLFIIHTNIPKKIISCEKELKDEKCIAFTHSLYPAPLCKKTVACLYNFIEKSHARILMRLLWPKILKNW